MLNLGKLDKIFDTLAVRESIKEYWKLYPYQQLDISRNPLVPTRAIFITEVFTMAQMILNNDPVEAHKNNEFADTNNVYYWGDNTVNLFSLALTPLNWLAEYLSLYSTEVNNFDTNTLILHYHILITQETKNGVRPSKRNKNRAIRTRRIKRNLRVPFIRQVRGCRHMGSASKFFLAQSFFEQCGFIH